MGNFEVMHSFHKPKKIAPHFFILGRHEVGHIEDTSKVPLNEGKGCRFIAKFQVNKGRAKIAFNPRSRGSTSKIIHLSSIHVVSVPGNFHVSTHSADTQPDDPNMSHYINSLVMGDDIISDKQVRIHETRRNMK